MVVVETGERPVNLRVPEMPRTIEHRYLACQRLPNAKVLPAPGHLVAKVEQARHRAGYRGLAGTPSRPNMQVNASRKIETASGWSVHHCHHTKNCHLHQKDCLPNAPVQARWAHAQRAGPPPPNTPTVACNRLLASLATFMPRDAEFAANTPFNEYVASRNEKNANPSGDDAGSPRGPRRSSSPTNTQPSD